MKPLQTDHFLIFPRKAVSLAGLETVLGETTRIKRASLYHLQEPYYQWDKIKEDEVVVVCFDEWTISRLAFLTSVEPALVIEFDFGFLCFPLEVCDTSGQTVASLTLRATAYSCKWEGFAISYSVGRAVIAELEACLAANPMSLAPYEVQAPARGKLGWDGRMFHGEKKFSRPKNQIEPPRYEFRVIENPRQLVSTTELKKRRFTESWPPIELFAGIPNWIYALDEETRPGQDETTLKSASNQKVIDYRIAYTAGEAWLPDGRILPCLIGLDEGVEASVVCFDGERTWEVPCLPKGCNPTVALSDEHKRCFPLRVVSHLSQSRRDSGKTIRFVITQEGAILPWKYGESR